MVGATNFGIRGIPFFALKDYDTAIRLEPNNADAYYNRGNVRKAKGDLQGAWQDFSEDARLKKGYAC